MPASRLGASVIAVVLALVVALAGSAQAQSCAPPPTQAHRANASYSATAGDWNQDGLKDIALREYWDDFGPAPVASLLLSEGDGTFVLPRFVEEADAGNFLREAVDWDGSGGPDIVAVLDGQVFVSLNRGDGNFESIGPWLLGGNLVACASADFNDDGWPDLTSVDASGHRVLVLLNDGSGGMGVTTWLDTGVRPVDVEAADVDGNGLPDLLVLNEGSEDLSVYLNLGAAFAPEQRLGPMLGARRLVLARIDADAELDLVVASAPDMVRPWLADGAGSWAPGVATAIGGMPNDLLAADFDGDGAIDIVTTHETQRDLSLLFGAGDGSFAPEQRLGAGAGPVLAADVDGDGTPELVATLAPQGSVFVYDGLDTPGYPGHDFAAAGGPSEGLAIGDFEGNGLPDYVTAHLLQQSVSIVKAQPGGGYADATQHAAGLGVSNVTVLDVDGVDGPDVVAGTASSPTLWLFRNDGAGGFLPTETLPLGTEHSTSVGRANVDDASGPDLIIGGTLGGGQAWLNDGSGGFLPGASIPVGQPIRSLGDLDDDGLTDVVGFGWLWPGVFVSRNAGEGSFLDREAYPVEEGLRASAIGDADGDGDADIVGVTLGAGRLFLLRNRGDGTMTPVEYGPVFPDRVLIAHAVLADLDGRGGLDFAIVGNDADLLWVFRGGVDGAFASPVAMDGGNTPTGLAAVEVDGVPPLELVVANEWSGGFTVVRPCFESQWLLRSAAVTSLDPLTPALSTIMQPRSKGLALELGGLDGTPGQGEGDDDDAYLWDFLSGDVDPDPTVGTGAKPLVFYQTTMDSNDLRVWRGQDGLVRVRY